MRNSTHTAIGLAGAAGVCAVVGPGVLATIGCLAVSVLGSQLPDADQRGAKVHRLSRTERRNMLLATTGVIARLPLKAMLLFKHRGATHWLSTSVLISAVITASTLAVAPAAAFPIGVGLACGYALHTLADACTPSGSPLLGPFDRRRVHLLPKQVWIQTGGVADVILGVAAICVAVSFLTFAL